MGLPGQFHVISIIIVLFVDDGDDGSSVNVAAPWYKWQCLFIGFHFAYIGRESS